MNIPSNQANAPIEQPKAKTGGGKAVPQTATIKLDKVRELVQRVGKDSALRQMNSAFNKGLITQAQYDQAIKAIG